MIRVITVAALLLCSTLLRSEEAPREAALPFAKGTTVFGLGGAFGNADGDRAEASASLSFTVSRGVTDSVGPRWLRGRMAFAVEAVPIFVLSQESTAYAAGFNLLGRYYLDGNGKLRPFITLGAGMLISAKEIPDDASKVNFTPQIGFGFTFAPSGGRVWSTELRFHHISNGGRVDPNPGINSVVFQLTVFFEGE